MFGEIDYNFWVITKGRDTPIGWISPNEQQSPYYSGMGGGVFMNRTNTMSTNSLENKFTGGTTLRIGKMCKHHGWEVKSTIMQSQQDSYEGRYGFMDIQEDSDYSSVSIPYNAIAMDAVIKYYTKGAAAGTTHGWTTFYDPNATNPVIPTGYMSAGYFWAWFTDGTEYLLAPMAINFERYKLDSKISHWDLEANYIFRPHATRIGFFEFTGGVRYMQLDDSLTFNGWWPWRTTATTDTGTGTGTGGTATDTTTTIDPANAVWNFKAQNHIVGPQVGIRYIKKCSGRWSLIADTKFFAGFNTQNLKSNGEMGLRTNIYGTDTSGGTGGTTGGAIDPNAPVVPPDMYVPVGFANHPGSFRYNKTRTEFSPGIDFSLKANWQFTDAIAFNVGYNGIYLDRTARASLVNDYSIDSMGNIFGINSNVTQSTWMHGVSFGININRF